MSNETTWTKKQHPYGIGGCWMVREGKRIVADLLTEEDADSIIADHAAASRLAELQEENKQLQKVMGELIKDSLAEVKALQEELDAARAERDLARGAADEAINNLTRVAKGEYESGRQSMEAENATLTERAALADEMAAELTERCPGCKATNA